MWFGAVFTLAVLRLPLKQSDGRPTTPDQMMGKCTLELPGADALWFMELGGKLIAIDRQGWVCMARQRLFLRLDISLSLDTVTILSRI